MALPCLCLTSPRHTAVIGKASEQRSPSGALSVAAWSSLCAGLESLGTKHCVPWVVTPVPSLPKGLALSSFEGMCPTVCWSQLCPWLFTKCSHIPLFMRWSLTWNQSSWKKPTPPATTKHYFMVPDGSSVGIRRRES